MDAQRPPIIYGSPLPDDLFSPDGRCQTLGSAAAATAAAAAADASDESSHAHFLFYSLSVLKEKIQEVESLSTIFIAAAAAASPSIIPPDSRAMAIATMGTLIQETIVTASSMMFTCQQMALATTASAQNCNNNKNLAPEGPPVAEGPPLAEVSFCSSENNNESSWYVKENFTEWSTSGDDSSIHILTDCYNNQAIALSGGNGNNNESLASNNAQNKKTINGAEKSRMTGGDIIELAAADLLAKYTHYCRICGKGFKRDANLRMHMRAHGEEYKSSAALTNPAKLVPKTANDGGWRSKAAAAARNSKYYYSCPQEGCKWNQRHAKFQPLKSMVCVKNHYRRSHCPKVYACKRCSRKQFSVLSDLRTHEKHCGDVRWQCTCGTTFSRKDKLMGHVGLFAGHAPAAAGGGGRERGSGGGSS